VKHAIAAAQDNDIVFSDVGQFLKKRNHISYEYYNKLSEKLLKQETNSISGSLHDSLINDPSSSHLKIQVLSEYALARAKKDERLLSLEGVQSLSLQIKELQGSRAEIISQLDQNNVQLDKAFAAHSTDGEVLKTLITSKTKLTERFIEVSEALSSKIDYLNNQHLLVLSLSYFEDLNLSLPSTEKAPESYDRDTEELLSYIVSIAVQRNIALPSPGPEAPKSQWARDCLDSILSTSSLVDSPTKSKEILKQSSDIKEGENAKLKTALEDLQNAHQYLTRQYEEERNLNSTAMETHQKKKSSIEKNLSETLIQLEKSNQRSILVEHEKNVLQSKFDAKIRELNELKRQVINLKIENLGFVHPTSADKENLTIGSASPGNTDITSPTSPLTGVELHLDDSRPPAVAPNTPLMQKDVNSYKFQSPSSSKFNSSISVLRSEFKKLVNDMHTKFESELAREQNERRRLENLVKIYEERSNEIGP
jgi:hypothetical protein